MDLGLSGKKAIITGSTRGIGRAIANLLADEGVDLAICSRNQDEVNTAVSELSAKGVKVTGTDHPAAVVVTGRVIQPERELPLLHRTDVLVVGGGPAGVVAALAAKRAGAKVTLVEEDTDEEKTWQIVGEHEASVERGLLNIRSPIARALIGKDEGDSVEVRTPGGDRSYEVLKIVYN